MEPPYIYTDPNSVIPGNQSYLSIFQNIGVTLYAVHCNLLLGSDQYIYISGRIKNIINTPLQYTYGTPASGYVLTSDANGNALWQVPATHGTVTSFSSGNLSPLFTTSVANATTTPSLSFALVSQSKNLIYASPDGSSGNPTFRSLVAADIPSLPYAPSALTNTYIFVGNASNVATGVAMSGDTTIANTGGVTIGNNKVSYAKMQQASTVTLLGNPTGGTANISEITLGSGLSFSGTTLVSTGTGGTVTSFSAGNLSPLFTTSVATATTTPALTFALTTQTSYTILGNNTGSTAAPTFFAPTLASALFANQGTTTTVLHGNASGNPSWAAVTLTTDVTGTLPVGNGGTANTTFTAYSVICAGTTATGAFQNVSGLGTSGYVLTSNGAGALPTWQAASSGSYTAGTGLTLTGTVFSLTNPVALNLGGTNASLTASNGGIVYSTASALAILAQTSTVGAFLISNNNSAPEWSVGGANALTSTLTYAVSTLSVTAVQNSVQAFIQANGGNFSNSSALIQAKNGYLPCTINMFAPGSGSTPVILFAGGGVNLILGVSNSQSTISSSTYGMAMDVSGRTIFGAGVTSPTTTSYLSVKAGTTTIAPFQLISGTNLTTASAGAFEYDGTNIFITATTGKGRQALLSGHTIFAPVTTGTVALVNNEVNIVNPAGAIAAATINFPSSPKDNDTVIIKFTQAITTITWGNGTLVGGATTYAAGTSVRFVYDAATTYWY